MRKLLGLAIFAATIVLAGCATTPGGGVQAPAGAQNAVYAAHLAYDAALSGAVFYKELPSCPAKPLCKDPAVVATIQQADKVAFEALSTAQRIVRSPGASQPALQTAMTWAQEAIAAFGKVTALVRSQ